MAQTGRNEPCPCGSSKKYKRCCLEKDEAAATAARAQQQYDDVRHSCPCCGGEALAAGFVRAEDAALLDEMSNAVRSLVRGGKLDEAEQAARELLARFPQLHDGHDRLGMVYEARGDKKGAAIHYRMVAELARQHADDYDPKFVEDFQKLADRLDPPAGP